MLAIFICVATLWLPYTGIPIDAPAINYANSYLEARQKAKEHESPYLIFFEQKSCLPCDQYEQAVLTTADVTQWINANTIPVKVDIDDFDGFGLKKYYEVDVLPTMILFDAFGNELRRIQEPLPAQELLIALKNPLPKDVKKTEANLAPEPIVEDPTAKKSIIFTTQIGSYSSLENAKRAAYSISIVPEDELFVEKMDGIYKLFAGRHSSKETASEQQVFLKNNGIDGFVKTLQSNSNF